ncbi:MAG: hypothetical protein ACHQE5_07955 [Actinomycetes bacterium]
MNVRLVPWVLALVGLAVPLVGTGFAVWPVVALWVVLLALVWTIGRRDPGTRGQRIAFAVILFPALVLLGWEGGWWLIPADVAWLLIEGAHRPGA